MEQRKSISKAITTSCKKLKEERSKKTKKVFERITDLHRGVAESVSEVSGLCSLCFHFIWYSHSSYAPKGLFSHGTHTPKGLSGNSLTEFCRFSWITRSEYTSLKSPMRLTRRPRLRTRRTGLAARKRTCSVCSSQRRRWRRPPRTSPLSKKRRIYGLPVPETTTYWVWLPRTLTKNAITNMIFLWVQN